MPEEELAARVADVLSVDPDDFRERAEADAEVIKDAVEEGCSITRRRSSASSTSSTPSKPTTVRCGESRADCSS